MSTTAAITIFISYAQEDETLCKELEKHLQAMQHQQLIQIWHHRNINAGTAWEEEISEHLNAAEIILLLISPDFMNSGFCYGFEMELAMERYAKGKVSVIPVILRPFDWHNAPFGKLAALPIDGRPVTSPVWHSHDEAFLNVTEGIRKVIKDISVKSNSLSKKNIKITMLGASGVGKTSFMVAMYAAMRSDLAGFTLLAKKPRDHADLTSLWFQMIANHSSWPMGTSLTRLYSFQFNYALRELLTFDWLDYRGGVLDEYDDNEDVERLHHHIEQSSHVFLCVSGEYLIEGISGHEAIIRYKARLDEMFILLTRLLQEKAPPTIVIVVTKVDLVSHRRKEDLISDIRMLFHILFVPNSPWKVAICPVTLGINLCETGKIEPINVHLPIMFSLYETLREKETQQLRLLRYFLTQTPFLIKTSTKKVEKKDDTLWLEMLNSNLQQIGHEIDKNVKIYHNSSGIQLLYEETQVGEEDEIYSVGQNRILKIADPNELLSSSTLWAPLIFGRTFRTDYRFITIPRFFTQQDIMWARPYIEGTFSGLMERDSPCWVIFKNDRYCVIGMSCTVSQISQDNNRDEFGRSLKVFLGFVSDRKQSQTIPKMDLELFAELYALVKQNWRVDLRGPYSAKKQDNIYVLPTDPLSPAEDIQLNTKENFIAIWPETYREKLWVAVFAHHAPISLCLGLPQRYLAWDKEHIPFLNVSVINIDNATLLLKSNTPSHSTSQREKRSKWWQRFRKSKPS